MTLFNLSVELLKLNHKSEIKQYKNENPNITDDIHLRKQIGSLNHHQLIRFSDALQNEIVI